MSNDLLLDTIKAALVEAFFQTQRYTGPNGDSHYYGGTIEQVIKKILESTAFQTVQKDLLEQILSEKARLLADCLAAFEKKVIEQTEYLVQDGMERGWGNNGWIRKEIETTAPEMIHKALLASEDFQKHIEQQISAKDFTLKIEVICRVEKTKE